MSRFIFFLVFIFFGDFAAFAQKNPIVVPPSLHSPFDYFRSKRVDDSTIRENTKAALEFLLKRCDNQLIDSDMMIIVHGDSLELKRAENELKMDDVNIKPVEEEIKKLIRDSKGDPVLFRSLIGPLQMKVEHYFIQDDRAYFWNSFDNLKDSNNCQ